MALLIFTSKVTNNDKGLMNCTDNTEDYSYAHHISMHTWKKHFKAKKISVEPFVTKMLTHAFNF